MKDVFLSALASNQPCANEGGADVQPELGNGEESVGQIGVAKLLVQ